MFAENPNVPHHWRTAGARLLGAVHYLKTRLDPGTQADLLASATVHPPALLSLVATAQASSSYCSFHSAIQMLPVRSPMLNTNLLPPTAIACSI